MSVLNEGKQKWWSYLFGYLPKMKNELEFQTIVQGLYSLDLEGDLPKRNYKNFALDQQLLIWRQNVYSTPEWLQFEAYCNTGPSELVNNFHQRLRFRFALREKTLQMNDYAIIRDRPDLWRISEKCDGVKVMYLVSDGAVWLWEKYKDKSKLSFQGFVTTRELSVIYGERMDDDVVLYHAHGNEITTMNSMVAKLEKYAHRFNSIPKRFSGDIYFRPQRFFRLEDAFYIYQRIEEIEGVMITCFSNTLSRSDSAIIYKWKNVNTVDVLVTDSGICASSTDGSPILIEQEPFTGLDLSNYLSKIVELTCNGEFVRIRDDKVAPNSIITVKEVMLGSRVSAANIRALARKTKKRDCTSAEFERLSHNAYKIALFTEHISQGMDVLDIGAGKGTDIYKYRYAQIRSLLAVDNDPEKLKDLRQRAAKANVRFELDTLVGDFNSLKCWREIDDKAKTFFDVVVFSFSLQFGAKDELSLGLLLLKVSQLLKPGGKVIIFGNDPYIDSGKFGSKQINLFREEEYVLSKTMLEQVITSCNRTIIYSRSMDIAKLPFKIRNLAYSTLHGHVAPKEYVERGYACIFVVNTVSSGKAREGSGDDKTLPINDLSVYIDEENDEDGPTPPLVIDDTHPLNMFIESNLERMPHMLDSLREKLISNDEMDLVINDKAHPLNMFIVSKGYEVKPLYKKVLVGASEKSLQT